VTGQFTVYSYHPHLRGAKVPPLATDIIAVPRLWGNPHVWHITLNSA